MPNPEILPDPNGDVPPQPAELPDLPDPGLDIPEIPNRPGPLGDDVTDGTDGGMATR